MDMDRLVKFRELVELKDWMLTHFVTKQEFSGFKQEFFEFKEDTTNRLERLTGLYADLKQEYTFTNQSLRRIEAKLGI